MSHAARYTDAFTPPFPLPDAEPDTVGTWHFSEGAGQRVTDAAGRLSGFLGALELAEPTDPRWVSPPCPLVPGSDR